MSGEINESYIQYLKQFDEKLQTLQDQKKTDATAITEVQSDVEFLRYKV